MLAAGIRHRLACKIPRLETAIQVDSSTNLRRAPLDRELDLSILLGPVSEYQVDSIDLPEFILGWYCTRNERLPEPISDSLLHKPVITYARNTRPFREFESA